MRTGSEEAAVSEMARWLPPGSGDQAEGMVRLARYVAERDHQVAVCTTAADGGIVAVIYDKGEWFI